MNKKIPFLLIFALIAVFIVSACSPNPESNLTQATADESNKGQVQIDLEPIATSLPLATQVQKADTETSEQEVEALLDGGAANSGVIGIVAPASVADRSGGSSYTGSTFDNVETDVVIDIDVDEPIDGEGTFADYGVNPFVNTADDHLSTFAMDVDTASFTLARSYLQNYNQLPPAEAIRSEEFINYFDMDYQAPTDDAFAIYLDAAPSIFGEEGQIMMRVGIQGKEVAAEDRQSALLIFVIDTSGSMDAPNRLAMAKESLKILVDELREDDRIGIVIYSDIVTAVLEPTPASDKDTIIEAIDSLHSSGSTYAEAGLRLGYEMAIANMQSDVITRVILLSDGVANVGETGPEGILNRVRNGVEEGVTLSTIGFGMGTYNDVMMEQLANDGNGNYFYIDEIREARRIFSTALTSTLQVIGYDAKIQVDFDPELVDSYRLIGYENRAVADVDFRNDSVDAGEVGAGHNVTALYEVVLKPDAKGKFATAAIRYQDADTREVVELSSNISTDAILDDLSDASASFRLAVGLAEFSELLRGSYWAEDGDYASILDLLSPMVKFDANAAELYDLVKIADDLS
ncbi:VWA domain-containing protein [Anaerolineales bacterium]